MKEIPRADIGNSFGGDLTGSVPEGVGGKRAHTHVVSLCVCQKWQKTSRYYRSEGTGPMVLLK